MVFGMPEARGRRTREGRKGCERLSLWEGKERETTGWEERGTGDWEGKQLCVC